MNNEQNTNSADIVISDDVIEKIAKTATLEVDGVVAVTTSLKTDLIDKISKKNHNRGVNIVKDDNDISITVSVVIYYDYNINEVASKIQDKVTDAIEAMTGHNYRDWNKKKYNRRIKWVEETLEDIFLI